MEDDDQPQSSLACSSFSSGKREFDESPSSFREEENELRQCSFCEFHFKRLAIVGTFCSFECALGHSKVNRDLYDAYFSLASSYVQPHLQSPYCPKPGVKPLSGERHESYIQRNIQALYANSRIYEIDRYKDALFTQSEFLNLTDALEFHREIAASKSKKK